jgi:hypothetical protein
MQQHFLDAFPDIPEPLDADSGQRCKFLDTGQRLHLANSSTTSVHISDLQHSAAGTAANQETANMANDSPLDDSNADYSDSGKGHQCRIRAQHRHRQDLQRLIQQSRAQCRQSQGGSVDHYRFTDKRYESTTSVARAATATEVHVLAVKQRRGFPAYNLLITVLYSSVL